ncbi:SDR family oxidoreductase [Carboxylicivirga sp. N1Y90]|uniref:SDR family oxidoreductase n=1 Tax=Carboxylicivirga fragile TaxID=3417571 RepID=UPI003D32ED23|nr:SDR family oxidoreductase [Marinilabiliaceae bacterium N1Y90]
MADSVVWITGASSGIGEELAYAYAREGARLVLTARREDKLNLVREKCLSYTKECFVFPADLSSTDQLEDLVDNVIKQTGTIDVLVNNAGISQRSLAHATPLENDRKIMEINFFSAVALTKLVLPYMIKNRSGHIVAISSIVGKFGFPLRSAYSAAKHALQGFFESLRAELKADNIKVTIVSPGRIKTEVSKNALTKEGVAHGEMDPGQDKGMRADVCANIILKAIKKEKKDILVGGKELLMVYIYKYLPALYNRIVTKVSSK